MGKKNILVFPCGSEVALEIYRSLQYSTHFNLIGASSVDDHGRFVFENYIGGVPFINEPNFFDKMTSIVEEYKVDYIFPAMDEVIVRLKSNEVKLGCKVIASNPKTTEICLSKKLTYTVLKEIVKTPEVYVDIEEIPSYPVFLKPEIGYGSRGVLKAGTAEEARAHLLKYHGCMILEFLPGKEYTVDCFSNFKGNLMFAGARERSRISQGISVNSSSMQSEEKFYSMAVAINAAISPNGAWFFQVKENEQGELVLMEVASRMAGSSAVYRAKGINFASLSVFNAMGYDVEILENNFEVQMDRALDNVFRIDITFNHVYVDFDDTVLMGDKVNGDLVGVLFNFVNSGKKLHLITKHKFDIYDTLSRYRLNNVFDSIIHLKQEDEKFRFIEHRDSIFIDDSFAERKQIKEQLGIPVFGLDIIKFN
ncbi:MAG: ATP-grasp domain-containing protein [Crocinitomicaceae bacterium]|nr:ATP-grasp domain-containing protein [Crocinitomicaceae bacterium]